MDTNVNIEHTWITDLRTVALTRDECLYCGTVRRTIWQKLNGERKIKKVVYASADRPNTNTLQQFPCVLVPMTDLDSPEDACLCPVSD